MSQLNNAVRFSKGLADTGTGIDFDKMFGWQCVDLSAAIVYRELGIRLYGNASQLLDSAESQGVKVVRYSRGIKPKAGWIFVMHYFGADGIDYGHTGVVIEDSDGVTMKTIEQNVDGNADYLEVGGPARYYKRDMSQMMGFIVLEDKVSKSVTNELIEEVGTFTLQVDAINVRRQPSLNGEIVAIYEKGMSVHYDGYLSAEGYRWISYIGNSGKRNYMAIGEIDNSGNRISLWGELS